MFMQRNSFRSPVAWCGAQWLFVKMKCVFWHVPLKYQFLIVIMFHIYLISNKNCHLIFMHVFSIQTSNLNNMTWSCVVLTFTTKPEDVVLL